jgi:hypothetical protein
VAAETTTSLRICDDMGGEVLLQPDDAAALWVLTDAFDAATVSACPDCRCRVLAAVAVVDVLDRSRPHPSSGPLAELADEAPTLHLYVEDLATECRHRGWLDPLAEEWADVVVGPSRRPIR